MMSPGEPSQTSESINSCKNPCRSPAIIPQHSHQKRRNKKRVRERLMQPDGKNTDEGREIKYSAIALQIEPKPDGIEGKMGGHGVGCHAHEEELRRTRH